jgi:hypothetical protein
MHLKRTTIIFVVCAAVAAWFSAAMTPGGPRPAIVLTPPPAVDISGAALAAEISRLHERLRPDAAPREHTRNLFAFRSGRRSTSASGASSPAASDVQPAAVPAQPPPLTLAGLAEDAGPNGPVRTAVVTGDGQLSLLQEGETFTVRSITYRVAKISANSVELIDVSDGRSRTLPLK